MQGEGRVGRCARRLDRELPRRGPCYGSRRPGADITRRAAFIGANFHQSFGHVHGVGGHFHVNGERRALDDSRQERRFDAEMLGGLLVDLEENGAQVLEDAGHAVIRLGSHGHAAVWTQSDALGAVEQGRSAARRCRDDAAHGQDLVGVCGGGRLAGRSDADHTADLHQLPIGRERSAGT